MKSFKSLVFSLMVIISAITMIGCSTSPAPADTENIVEDVPTTITIKHELDEITVDKNPEKVIVFDYGILDALDNIGEDIIGLPKKSVPPYLDKYKGEEYIDLGTLQEPNFETIYELKPDLIIISARQASLYDEFKKIAPTLYLNIDGGDYMNSFKFNMGSLGKIFDKEELMAEKVTEIEASVKNLNDFAKSNGKTGLFVMANDGNLSAFGAGSRFGVLHNEFGVTPVDETIAPSTHGDKISFEYIVEKDADYIYVMDRAAIAGGDISAKQVMDNDLIKSTKAYKNDNIIYLDSYIWYVSSGGLTGTIKMVDEIQSSLEK